MRVGDAAPARRRFTPRLQTVFIAAQVLLLLVPVGGLFLLRLYESVLVRRTESALIAQGSLVAAAFRAEMRREMALRGTPPPGVPLPKDLLAERGIDPGGRLQPIPPRLDLAVDRVLPAPLPASVPAHPADPLAVAAGARLVPLLRDASQATLAGMRIVDAHGVIVASTSEEMGLSLAEREEVSRALTGEAVSLLRERGEDADAGPTEGIIPTARLRVFVAVPVIADGRSWGAVVVSRVPPSAVATAWRLRWLLLGGTLAILAAALSLSLYTSRTVTRPVQELIARTERLAEGDWTAREPLERPGTLEIEQLSQAFARLGRTLEEREDYITSIAAQVSHEFKTPLTAIRGSAELLREHGFTMTVEERDKFLSNIQMDAERLTRLTHRLLELARADVSKPVAVWTRIAPVLLPLIERHGALGLDVSCSIDEDADSARMPAEALEAIVGNLLDNARRHGGRGVRVHVAVSTETRADMPGVLLQIKDNGPGISEANARRVFTPFFTTAREAGGTGLGLSIVRSLLHAHGGSITMASRAGETTFAAWVPS